MSPLQAQLQFVFVDSRSHSQLVSQTPPPSFPLVYLGTWVWVWVWIRFWLRHWHRHWIIHKWIPLVLAIGARALKQQRRSSAAKLSAGYELIIKIPWTGRCKLWAWRPLSLHNWLGFIKFWFNHLYNPCTSYNNNNSNSNYNSPRFSHRVSRRFSWRLCLSSGLMRFDCDYGAWVLIVQLEKEVFSLRGGICDMNIASSGGVDCWAISSKMNTHQYKQ